MLTADVGCCIESVEGDRGCFIGRIKQLQNGSVEASYENLTTGTDGNVFSPRFISEILEFSGGKRKRRSRRFCWRCGIGEGEKRCSQKTYNMGLKAHLGNEE